MSQKNAQENTERMSTEEPQDSQETFKSLWEKTDDLHSSNVYTFTFYNSFTFHRTPRVLCSTLTLSICMCDHLTQTGSGTGTLDDGVFARVVQDRTFGKRDICCHPGDGYSGIYNKNNRIMT